MTDKIRRNWKRIFSSVMASAFFFYFWINGPINQQIQSLVTQTTLSIYGIPKLIGEESTQKESDILLSSISNGDSSHGLINKLGNDIHKSGMINSKPRRTHSDASNAELIGRALQVTQSDPNEVELIDNYIVIGSNLYFESSPTFDHMVGYAGPINIGLLLTLDNQIEKVFVIASDETDSYMRQIQNDGYYQRYEDLVIDQGDKQIDAVSGATITTHTVGEIVEAMIHEVTENLPNYASTGNHIFTLQVTNSLVWIVHITLIILLFIFGYQNKIGKNRKNMTILGILSVVYIGFFLNNSFTYISFMEPFLGVSLSALTGIYAFASLIAAIWGNNLYCNYVCPFGHTQRLFVKLPFAQPKKLPVSKQWIDRFRNLLTLVLITGILFGFRHWKNYEVFPLLFDADIVSFGFLIALLFLIVAMIYPMFWCRVACPTGCVLDTVKRINK